MKRDIFSILNVLILPLTLLHTLQQTSLAQESPEDSPGIAFSPQSGTFIDRVSLELGASEEAAQIRYTLNGESPANNEEALEAKGPLALDGSTLVRAIAGDDSEDLSRSETFIEIDLSVRNFSSDLPVMILENFSQGKPSNETPTSLLLYEPNSDTGRTSLLGEADYFSRCGVGTYGSRSSTYPKYSMTIELWNELDEAVSESLLGLGSGSDWVLEGPYNTDRSLIRNVLMYDLSRQMGTYAPRTRFVEVFVNTDGGTLTSDDYYGVYVLTEAVRPGKDRVNLESTTEQSDGSRTGYIFGQGFPVGKSDLFEIDGFGRLIWTYPKGEDLASKKPEGDERARYLIDYLNNFTLALTSRNAADQSPHYSEFMDTESWVDELILRTLCKDSNGFLRSTYFYKPLNGKLHRGPVWDLDSSIAHHSEPIGWTHISGNCLGGRT